MTTIVAAAGGGNWNATGTWVGGVVPTAADDVQLASSSGNVTVNAASVCRSLDCTGYTGTLTHNTSQTLTIGDGTAGASSIALKMVSGMTYTAASSTAAVSFVSTSATVQSIDAAGKSFGNVTINGAGSSYRLDSALNTLTTALVTLTAGALNTNGQTCSWGGFGSSNSNVRSLTLGASSITITSVNGWTISTVTNLTFSAGTSTITFTGTTTSANLGTNLNYNNIVATNSATFTLTSSGGVGTGTIANFTRTGTATKTDVMQFNTSFVITGTLTLNGNSDVNRLWIETAVIGQFSQLTVNGSIVASNCGFSGIIGAGTASWNLSAITGGCGDGGGNTGITFTTSVTQTWQGTSGGNWSDVTKWTSRVPLSQDDVVISSAFTAGQTITMDMPRLGRSIDWTGSTGAPTWAITSTASAIFGSLTLVVGMIISGTGSTLVFRGRSSYTITSNGVAFPAGITINAAASTYTLQDALTLNTGVLTVGSSPHRGGTLNTNGQTVTCPSLVLGNTTGFSILTLGASTINLTATAAGAIFTATVASGNVINAGTSEIVIVNASANDRNIVASGFVLGTITYTVAGSTGRLIFGITGATGTVTITTLNFSDVTNARSLRIWAGTTLAILTAFNVFGTAGKLMTIESSTAGTRATLTKSTGSLTVSVDYVSIIDSAGAGTATWYAGANSTNAGNNTGWTFTAPPAVINAGKFFAFI